MNIVVANHVELAVHADGVVAAIGENIVFNQVVGAVVSLGLGAADI